MDARFKNVCGGLAVVLACSMPLSVLAAETAEALDNVSQETTTVQKPSAGKSSAEAFENRQIKTDTLCAFTVRPKLSDYTIFSGTVIPGTLITGVNSDLPGRVIAQVSLDVYDSQTGRYLLIPQGTRLLGTYNCDTEYGQKRVQIGWDRMILPNGDSMVLPNFNAADNLGFNGIQDKVRSHYARVIWSALLGAVAGAGITSAGSSSSERSDYENEMRAQAAENITDPIDKIVEKNINVKPTLSVRPGFKFNIIISQDLIIKPYES